MFCPTCIRSYPDDSQTCPKCQGALTNVIEIFADDEPPGKKQCQSQAPTTPEDSAEHTDAFDTSPPSGGQAVEPEAASSGPAEEGERVSDPPPDEEVQVVKAAFGSSSPDLWVASTVLCTILIFVVVLFDSSRSTPEPQPSPTTVTEQLQAREQKPARSAAAPLKEPKEPTPDELRTQANAILLQAKRSRKAGELERAEEQAEEAFRLHSEIEENDDEIAYSLEELAMIHVEMDDLVKARAELNKAQRLVYSSERKELLANLTSSSSTSSRARQEQATTTAKTRPTLGEASGVPQAAPRAVKSRETEEQPVARRRMKEIEAYRPETPEQERADIPLGQQDVIESYRGTRRGTSQIPGLR